jgi:hypothetical protein
MTKHNDPINVLEKPSANLFRVEVGDVSQLGKSKGKVVPVLFFF